MLPANACALRIEGIVAGYYAGQRVLNGVGLAAQPARLTAIFGPNGAGKSTLLRVAAGLIRPIAGRVRLDGRDITELPAHERLGLGIAFLPQGRSVFPDLTVHENIELGGWIYRRDPGRLRRALAATYERSPQLFAWRMRPAGSLSGGQQRLVEIARMMVADPRVVLVDEPSAGLAPNIAEVVYRELAGLKAHHRTILLVDQNVRAALDISDYVITLESGQNRLEGDPARFRGALDQLIKGWLRV